MNGLKAILATDSITQESNTLVSNMEYVTCGVPQGSVLGPLLFLIYMNDIAKALPGEKIKLFADDTNLFIFDKDSNLVCTKATDCLNKFRRWLVAN